MDNEYERAARSEEMMRAVMRNRTSWEVFVIIISTVVLALLLDWFYDYIKFALVKFGFFSTLPFWFVCYAVEYWLLRVLGNFQFTKSNVFCASCLGVDMMVLAGYAMGKMKMGGYLMLAFIIGFLIGPMFAVLIEQMDEARKRNTKNPNKPSMDCVLTATLNRKVATYSFLFLVCMSILKGWAHRL